MKVEFDVNLQQLEEEINYLLKTSTESRTAFPNINKILKKTESTLIKISEDQKKLTDFYKGRKGISSPILMILFVIILFVIILFIIILIALIR